MLHRNRLRRPTLQLAIAGLVAALMVGAASCGGDEGAADRFEAAKEAARSEGVDPDADRTTDTTTEAPVSVPGSDAPAPTAAAAPVAAPADQLTDAVAAFTEAVGAPVRALEYTQHFPVGEQGYASLQYQVPDNPANVDNRDWRNGKVGDPGPVQLSGDGDLEENLFSLDEINWPAIAAALGTAQGLVEAERGGPMEGSTGVTHIIATKDLPFSPNTVVRVYVDGGTRAGSAYVSFLADGTLDKVQA